MGKPIEDGAAEQFTIAREGFAPGTIPRDVMMQILASSIAESLVRIGDAQERIHAIMARAERGKGAK